VAGRGTASVVRLACDNGVYVLTLDRASVGNAVNRQMTEELAEALTVVEVDRAARALIVTGAGDRFFCTGGDVKEYARLPDREAVEKQFRAMQQVCDRLSNLPVPSIAALNGDALGGGVELSVACDFRIARSGITLCLPQVRLGLVTGWGAHDRIVRLLGEGAALDLLLTGRAVSAPEALQLGLLTRLAKGGALEAAQEMEVELGHGRASAARAMKRIVRAVAYQSPAEARRMANETFFDLWFSEDHRKVERAFAERRSSASAKDLD
jgi:enoyl-CoA hydratase